MRRAPVVRGLALLSPWGRGAAALPGDAATAACGQAVLSLGRPAREGERWRRATREGLLALAAVEAAVEDAGGSPADVAGDGTALIYVTAAAYAPSNRRFIEGRGGGIHFAETAPAVAPAEVAMALGVSGPYAIMLGGPPTTLRAVAHAASLLERGACERALVLAVEIFDECADLYLRGGRLTGRPLVEAAACCWLEPGDGRLSLGPGGPRRGRAPIARRLGESLSVEPLAALDAWRAAGAAGTLELTARWRGEGARLCWTEPLAARPRARSSQTGG